ncbi:hypothetical protein CERSUDRAFT_71365 [Gelatoporia subvermispora B]|uniref:Uncharacterized protein n=1 Tax=Ceriporiopsis subvermispora (strain B) TaxID=914234 RepID=M2QQW1_CERS8|nr:hypothetical protein CERSUDRAFT_71365 [Gelatoporia subvermispora B]
MSTAYVGPLVPAEVVDSLQAGDLLRNSGFSPFGSAAEFITPLASIIISHFLMSLRQSTHESQQAQDDTRYSATRSRSGGTSQSVSLRFASFVGDMGEFLGHDSDYGYDEADTVAPGALGPRESCALERVEGNGIPGEIFTTVIPRPTATIVYESAHNMKVLKINNDPRVGRKEVAMDYDILHIVLGLSSKPEILSLMTKCRDMHEVGIKRLLALDIPIHKNNTFSFAQFMLADPQFRLMHLQHLHIVVPEGPFEVLWMGMMLHDILGDSSRPPQIKTISITHSERWLSANRWFYRFCISLQGLEEIDLREVGRVASKLLQEVSSEIVTARIAFDSQYPRAPPHDISSLLVNSTTRLQDLRYYGAWFQSHTVQFLALHTLEIPHCDITEIKSLLLTFPNLRSLYTTSKSWSGDIYLGRHTHIRDINLAFQEAHGRWTRLDRLSGSMDQIYVLGITSPVEFLELESKMSIENLTFVSALLADANPSRLRLILNMSYFPLALLPEMLNHSTALSHVYLTVDLPNNGAKMSDIIRILMEQVRLLPPLTHLVIRWSTMLYGSLNGPKRRSNVVDDLANLGRAIMGELPSLRFVGIESTNRAGYCMRGGDQTQLSQPVVIELTEEDGRRVISEEQMTWRP